MTLRLGERVTELPATPVIVATEPADARALLGDDSLRVLSGHTVCVDLAVERRRGDPFVVSDLDECGWAERYTAADPSLAPPGEELIQAQMPIRPGEDADAAAARLDALLDLSFPDRAARTTWHRRLVMDGRTGALDPPGQTWRDRPAVDRGGGVLLAGDWVAAPGLLSEVAWASAVEAGRLALAAAATRGRHCAASRRNGSTVGASAGESVDVVVGRARQDGELVRRALRAVPARVAQAAAEQPVELDDVRRRDRVLVGVHEQRRRRDLGHLGGPVVVDLQGLGRALDEQRPVVLRREPGVQRVVRRLLHRLGELRRHRVHRRQHLGVVAAAARGHRDEHQPADERRGAGSRGAARSCPPSE